MKDIACCYESNADELKEMNYLDFAIEVSFDVEFHSGLKSVALLKGEG